MGTQVPNSKTSSLFRRNGVTGSNYGPMALAATTDVGPTGITDQAYRFLGLIGGLSWKGPCEGTPLEFANAIDCTERAINKHILNLEKKYLNVEKDKTGIKRYSLKPEGRMVIEEKLPIKAAYPCGNPECATLVLRRTVHGLCGECAGNAALSRVVLEARKILGPDATAKEITNYLKTHKLESKVEKVLVYLETQQWPVSNKKA